MNKLDFHNLSFFQSSVNGKHILTYYCTLVYCIDKSTTEYYLVAYFAS